MAASGERLGVLAQQLSKLIDEDSFSRAMAEKIVEEMRDIIKLRLQPAEAAITEPFLAPLLLLADKTGLGNREDDSLGELAIRAVMNALFENVRGLAAFEDMQGPVQVFQLLQRPLPLSAAFYTVKLLYMLFSSTASLAVYLLSLSLRTNDSSSSSTTTGLQIRFSDVIVATFVTSTKGEMTATKRDLFVDCCKLLYSIEHFYHAHATSASQSNPVVPLPLPSLADQERTLRDVQQQVVEMLLRNTRDKSVFTCQQSCLQLLLLATPQSLRSLCCVDGTLDALLRLLDLLLAQHSADKKADGPLATILVVLASVAAASEEARARLRKQVLPPEHSLKHTSDDANAPPVYSPGSLMGRLLPLFISLNPQISRAVAELIYSLCGNQVDTFVKYCGLGSAAGLLHAKGLLLS